MDYSRFKFNAVVDWLSIEVHTQNFTNFQTIKRRLNIKHVKPLNKTSGGSANKFLFKIHDPKNWFDIQKLLQNLNTEYPFSEPPVIRSMEVSFDAYSKTENRNELVELTHSFFRNLANPISQNVRFSGKKDLRYRKPLWGSSNRTTKCLFNEGRNLCLGNIEHKTSYGKKILADSKYMQIYTKTTDNNGVPLVIKKHRARIEIRLEGEELPFEQIDDAIGFKFESLSKYFKMLKLNTTLLEKIPVCFNKAIQNLNQLGNTNVNVRRKYSLITNADTELNDKVYNALRDLSRKMQRHSPKSG